ncbi:MAG: Asp23/Gls24 family envelope stress response protein [Chloroflexi bacterium]|nr:Asp23/Gls24 family envelope stress response protein [Chloroflexota bacterium]
MNTDAPGKIVIAPEVLITIAKLSTLSVPGVARMAAVPGGIDRYIKRGYADGVRIQVIEHSIRADLHIVVKGDVNVHAVSRAVQDEVSRAMAEMVGMEAKVVNVHVEDIIFTES